MTKRVPDETEPARVPRAVVQSRERTPQAVPQHVRRGEEEGGGPTAPSHCFPPLDYRLGQVRVLYHDRLPPARLGDAEVYGDAASDGVRLPPVVYNVADRQARDL